MSADEVQQIVKETVTGDYQKFMTGAANGNNPENVLSWTWSKSVTDMSQQEQPLEPKVSSRYVSLIVRNK